MPEPVELCVKPGDLVAGKYRVERVLGSGGMGVVVAAHHVQLDEKVALKFLLPEALKNAEAVARFIREARAAVKIKSEHVARLSDVGQLENGVPYMVMEYLEGSDLSAWLREKGPLPIEQAGEFVLQACEAIAEAHAQGIVHRDLKPANLFCIRRADGRLSIKVLDFGISKVTAPGGDQANVIMTATRAIVGSPVYMSPEQMQASKRVDARTDIWSLGVILFELLSGRVPFEGEVVTQLAIQIATAPPLPLRELRKDVTEGLQRVVLRCLEKDRERRFHDVGELATALEPYGGRRARISIDRVVETLEAAGIAARRESASNGASDEKREPEQASAGTGTIAPWGTATGHSKRASKAVLFAAGGVAALILIGAGIALLSGSSSSTATTGAPSATASTAPAPQISAAPEVVSALAPAPSDSAVSLSDMPTATPVPTPSSTQAPAPRPRPRPGPPASSSAGRKYNPLEHL